MQIDQTKLIACFKRICQDNRSLDVDHPDPEQLYSLPFSDELGIFFYYDKGENFAVAQTKHIEALAWTDEKLLRTGIKNLDEINKTIEISKINGIYHISGAENFEASLLLISELWEMILSDYCQNGFIATIPSRDVLAVCDKNDKFALNKLIAIVEKVWPLGNHLLTKRLFERKDNKWIPYEYTK